MSLVIKTLFALSLAACAGQDQADIPESLIEVENDGGWMMGDQKIQFTSYRTGRTTEDDSPRSAVLQYVDGLNCYSLEFSPDADLTVCEGKEPKIPDTYYFPVESFFKSTNCAQSENLTVVSDEQVNQWQRLSGMGGGLRFGTGAEFSEPLTRREFYMSIGSTELYPEPRDLHVVIPTIDPVAEKITGIVVPKGIFGAHIPEWFGGFWDAKESLAMHPLFTDESHPDEAEYIRQACLGYFFYSVRSGFKGEMKVSEFFKKTNPLNKSENLEPLKNFLASLEFESFLQDDFEEGVERCFAD